MRPTRPLLGAAVLIGSLALSPLLAGCGSSDSTTAQDSPPSGTSSPSSAAPTGSLPDGGDYDVTIISATGAGGEVASTATPLTDTASVTAYGQQFRSPAITSQLTKLVEQTDAKGQDQLVFAAVVSVGCDVPPGAVVQSQAGKLTVTPEEVSDPKPECLAPVTSVAVVTTTG